MTTNFGGVDVVPLQGAIVVCYGGGREGFGGVDVVPLLWGLCWYNFDIFFRKCMSSVHVNLSGRRKNPFGYVRVGIVLMIFPPKPGRQANMDTNFYFSLGYGATNAPLHLVSVEK